MQTVGNIINQHLEISSPFLYMSVASVLFSVYTEGKKAE